MIVSIAWAETSLKQGIELLKTGRYDDAINAFSSVLEATPSNYEAYCHRGTAWLHQGAYDQAISDFNSAIDINPDYANAYCNRGTAWFSKGAYDLAIADFTTAIGIVPNYHEAYNNRAVAWFYKKQYDKGIADCRRAIKVNPDYPAAYHQLAMILIGCPDKTYRNPKQAVELALKAVELNPSPDYYKTLASTYAAVKDYPKAIEAQKKVVALMKKEKIADPAPDIGRLQEYHQEMALLQKKQKATPEKSEKKAVDTPEFQESAKYPYTIHISSFREATRATREVMELKKKKYDAFDSPTHIPDKGIWRRVYIGYYQTMTDADTALKKLKKAFGYAKILKRPYTFLFGVFDSKTKLEKQEAEMHAKGLFGYRIPARKNPAQIMLLYGAFSTKEEADRFLPDIHSEGFYPKIIKR